MLVGWVVLNSTFPTGPLQICGSLGACIVEGLCVCERTSVCLCAWVFLCACVSGCLRLDAIQQCTEAGFFSCPCWMKARCIPLVTPDSPPFPCACIQVQAGPPFLPSFPLLPGEMHATPWAPQLLVSQDPVSHLSISGLHCSSVPSPFSLLSTRLLFPLVSLFFLLPFLPSPLTACSFCCVEDSEG